MSYWLFQGNPKYYRILDGIRDFEQMPWLVTRYAKEMSPGDGVLVWMSGPAAGIYAIAELREEPKTLNDLPDVGYWLDANRAKGKLHAQLRFTHKFLEQPLLRNDLRSDPILKDLLVIRAPNSTNFKVTPEQWKRVYELRRV